MLPDIGCLTHPPLGVFLLRLPRPSVGQDTGMVYLTLYNSINIYVSIACVSKDIRGMFLRLVYHSNHQYFRKFGGFQTLEVNTSRWVLHGYFLYKQVKKTTD
jgi:hypothetical protein